MLTAQKNRRSITCVSRALHTLQAAVQFSVVMRLNISTLRMYWVSQLLSYCCYNTACLKLPCDGPAQTMEQNMEYRIPLWFFNFVSACRLPHHLCGQEWMNQKWNLSTVPTTRMAVDDFFKEKKWEKDLFFFFWVWELIYLVDLWEEKVIGMKHIIKTTVLALSAFMIPYLASIMSDMHSISLNNDHQEAVLSLLPTAQQWLPPTHRYVVPPPLFRASPPALFYTKTESMCFQTCSLQAWWEMFAFFNLILC